MKLCLILEIHFNTQTGNQFWTVMTLMNLMNYSKVPCYIFLMITFLFRLKTYIIKQTVNHGLPQEYYLPFVQTAVLKKRARSIPDRYLTIYQRHKNLLTKVTCATRDQYYRTLLETSIGNSKKIWSNINCILGKKHSSINTTIKLDGNHVAEPETCKCVQFLFK